MEREWGRGSVVHGKDHGHRDHEADDKGRKRHGLAMRRRIEMGDDEEGSGRGEFSRER